MRRRTSRKTREGPRATRFDAHLEGEPKGEKLGLA